MRFVAIDFETANTSPDSACAIGLVRVERGRIVRRLATNLRPPTREFTFTYVHGLTWSDCATAPTFADFWPELVSLCAGVDFLAAHNASFDESVLRACAARARRPMLTPRFVCTVRLARQTWSLYPTKLPDVARHLGIPLRHHDAASDAEACARIVMAAHRERSVA